MSSDLIRFALFCHDEERTFTLHSGIVASLSPFVKHAMRELKQTSDETPVYWVSATLEAFLAFSQFVYTGDYRPIRGRNSTLKPTKNTPLDQTDEIMEDDKTSESEDSEDSEDLRAKTEIKVKLHCAGSEYPSGSKEALNIHLETYNFARVYRIGSLMKLALQKMRGSLVDFMKSCPPESESFIARLISRYCGDIEDEELFADTDDMTDLFVWFMAPCWGRFSHNDCFQQILDDHVHFARDILKRVMKDKCHCEQDT